MAVMIIGILSEMYMAPPGGGTEGGANYYIDKSKAVACMADRNVLATSVAEYQITHNHFPTIGQLEKSGASVPRCPDGGKYYILDGKVYCTVHSEVTIPSPN